MKFRLSSILIIASLVLLSGFFTYWLRQEFMKEKEGLKNLAFLNVAQEVIAFGGGNFDAIIAELEDSIDNRTMEVSMSFSQEPMSECDLEDTLVYFTNKKHINSYTFSTTSGQNEHPLTQIIDLSDNPTKGGMKIMIKRDSALAMDRSENTALNYDPNLPPMFEHEGVFTPSDSNFQDFIHILKEDFVQNEENINTRAFINILPQFGVALFLISLLVLAIVILQRGFRQQRLLLENKNNLISNITHELKTPVATISIALEAIQDFNIKNDPEKTQNYISTSRKELKRLSDSIEQVMTFSKMDAGQYHYEFKGLSINTILAEVLDQLSLKLQSNSIEVETDFNPDLDKIFGDEHHLQNIFINLIDNAIKYGKSGVQINISSFQIGREIKIKVEDNGPGIEKKFQQKIFDRFYRIPNGNIHNVKGYGLGLSYVKEVITAHKGTVQVQSELEKGSTFIIHLPVYHEKN